MKQTYILRNRAHAKIVLHACKYPARNINGVVIGRLSDGVVELLDAIPLYHSNLFLPSRLEVALQQVDVYARGQDLHIVGYYQAQEFIDEDHGASTKVVAQKISEKFPQACTLVVDNSTMKGTFADCIQIQCAGGSGDKALTSEYATTGSLVRQHAFRQLVDFEEHLTDVSKDWLNPLLTLQAMAMA